MKYKATLKAGQGEAYRIKWLSKTPFKNYKPLIDEINFYDDAKETDVLIPLTANSLEFKREPAGKNVYDVFFSGTIEFELNAKQKKALEEREFSIDYLMTFVGENDQVAESGEEYELVYNTNITLEDCEPA